MLADELRKTVKEIKDKRNAEFCQQKLYKNFVELMNYVASTGETEITINRYEYESFRFKRYEYTPKLVGFIYENSARLENITGIRISVFTYSKTLIKLSFGDDDNDDF